MMLLKKYPDLLLLISIMSSIQCQILDIFTQFFTFVGMAVAAKIKKKIEQMQDGTTFKYLALAIAPEEYSAATKAIERLIKKGLISRASTGLFYKPKKTAFGSLKPKEEELLKPFRQKCIMPMCIVQQPLKQHKLL